MAIDYTSDIGKVRLVLGDLDEENFMLSDEQIAGYLAIDGNIALACVSACRAIEMQFASSAGDKYRIDTIQYEEGKSKADNIRMIRESLEKSIAKGTNSLLFGVPIVTGIYIQDIEENAQKIIDGELIGPQIKDGEYEVIDYDNQDGPYYG